MNTQYQLGDILIFKAEDDYLSKCIAWLTDSDTSHSAMIYTKDSITESVAPGVMTNKIETGKGEAAYLLRLTPARNPKPLIDAAKKYLDAGTHYNFPSLLYLAGLLLFRKIRPTNKLLNITERIMTCACLELDKLLQKLATHPENRSMVCSQFVYQVYYDCGKDYQIRIHNESMNTLKQDTGAVRLYDLCNQNFTSANDASVKNRIIEESSDELIEQLYEALHPADLTNAVSLENFRTPPIIDLFSQKLHKLMEILDSDMPIDSLFVSPGDFVYHSENLENKGELLIERIF